ncbi:MAG: hypothetical protein Q8M99_05370 [Methylotenera sp.]|nr:hypothetical protein [Methylotenera sp.]
MTIKNIIYSAHQKLEQVASIPVKRSHIYELLAAAFGFNTYASLTIKAILIQRESYDTADTVNLALIQQRSEELGYGNIITKALPEVMKEHRISALSFSDLVDQLRNYDYSDEYDWESDDTSQLISPEEFKALEAAAKSGNSIAHYALALHHANSDESDEDGITSDYWYKQMQSGRELSGIEKEFALTYQRQLSSKNKYHYHLREAASLGCDLALLDLAEKFGDHAFFEGNHKNVDANPMRIAEIAENLGRPDEHRYWLNVAAEAGNITAMRELIESYEKDDLLRCWTWVYLSQLLGKDLTQDLHYAIHEDGSRYDDDVGGPMFVDGEDGIKLPPLESDQAHLAKTNAETLFNQMNIAN